MSSDPITFNHILGQGRVNQLGGVFINGRPLPIQIREAIITMAKQGIKPCHISRQLKVSHGAVSKILNRYAETGSISPGQIGGSPRARITIQAVEKQLIYEWEENPKLGAAELRELLIRKEICTKANAPTVAAINRLIRQKGISGRVKKMERKTHRYSIENILGTSSDECSKSSSDDEEGVSPSESSRRNRTSFTSDQLDALENAFKTNTYPDTAERESISKETGLSEEKISTWFSNRRARSRKNMSLYQHVYSSAAATTATSTTPSTNGATNAFPPFLTPPLLFLPTAYTNPQHLATPFVFPAAFLSNSPPSS